MQPIQNLRCDAPADRWVLLFPTPDPLLPAAAQTVGDRFAEGDRTLV